MKKNRFLLFIVLIVMAAALSACSENAAITAETGELRKIRIAGLTGPTSMGLVRLMEDEKYEFSVCGTADEVTPKLIKGELDMAAVPANLAAVLYNNTDGRIKLLAVNTLGVLYIVENGESVSSFEDLRGKTIYATGKGSTPEYTLRYLLSANGIDPDKDLKLEFKSEPAEVVAVMEQKKNTVAMLPEPYVTVAKGKVLNLNTRLDLTEEWEKTGTGKELITGVLAARSDFLLENPDAVKEFLKEYEASVSWVKENTAEASLLMEKYGIVKAAVAEKAIPRCNLTFISGEKLKAPVSEYLGVLYAENPKSVGGKMPGDDFYYISE